MTLIELLEKALTEPIGVIVDTPDPDGLRRRLYVTLRRARERREDKFNCLMVSSGLLKNELLIRRKPPEEEECPSET